MLRAVRPPERVTTQMTLEEYLQRLQDGKDPEALTKTLIDMLSGMGVNAVSGRELPYGASIRDADWAPIVSTFPESAKAAYVKYRAGGDPFFEAAMANGAPVHYHRIKDEFAWNDGLRALFQAMEDAGLRDGVATPVIAKPGVAAYFVATFPEPRPDLKPQDLRRIHLIFSEYYFRHRELTRLSKALLSKRERQILVGIISGKSNLEIGQQLGLSKGTIDTYVGRCFEKLGVNSRIEAALKYFSLGLHMS